MNACRLFLTHPMFFLLIIFFYGIILKRKEFVIQWRKFGLKRSCISDSLWRRVDGSGVSDLHRTDHDIARSDG